MIGRALLAGFAAAFALMPAAASAHEGTPPAPHDLWSSWNLDPLILASLALAGWLYARGVAALWRRAGSGRGVPRWRVAAFAGALLALALALVSPLDALSSGLFSAHMAQHQLLILVAALLAVLGAPLLPLLWALPRSWRIALLHWSRRPAPSAVSHVLQRPIIVLALFVTLLWAWHGPILYEAALAHETIHALEHACLFGVALLFWWTVLQPSGRRRVGYGSAVLMVFVAALQGTALGALIIFSGAPWYPAYATTAPLWGLTPLADQQLAGALMGAPADAVLLATVLALVASLIRTSEQNARRRELTLPRPPQFAPGAAMPNAHPGSHH